MKRSSESARLIGESGVEIGPIEVEKYLLGRPLILSKWIVELVN